MKPPINASKKTQTIFAGSLKNLRNIYKTNRSLATGADKPKTSCKYSETKKAKQVLSDIPDLKHKLLSSESTIRKLTWKSKTRVTSYELQVQIHEL